MQFSSAFLSALLAIVISCAPGGTAHGVITEVTGANGVSSAGFGVIATTPRDGSRRRPFQQDSSIIRDREIADGEVGVCGRTLAGDNNDVETQLDAAVSDGLPTVGDDGSVTMTLHQVNGDGAGPYTCEVSADATGNDFVPMTITTNVPGRNSRSRARATPFPLVAQMPDGMVCTGGANGDACLVRCRNDARAGPFGGCVAVTNADAAAAAAGNATEIIAEETVSGDAQATSVAADPAAAADNATETIAAETVSGDAQATSVAADPAGTSSAAVAAEPTPTAEDEEDDEDESEPEEQGGGRRGRLLSNLLDNLRVRRAIPRVRPNVRIADDEPTEAERDAALAADLEKRVLRSRISGRSRNSVA